MSWSGRPVFVSGAGGFIGSHLVERLVELGADVRALVHYNAMGSWGWLDESAVQKKVRISVGDVRDRDSVRQAMGGADVVFHLAALIAIPYSYQSPLSYVQTNIEGTLNILQAARELKASRIIHTSTSEAYGTARYVPIDEAHPLQGQSPYSATKIGADKIAESFHLSFGLPVVTVRPFNTYGPRQSARAVIPTIITQALTRKEIRLGNLDATRDLNFVADTVDAFVRAAECEAAIGQVLNAGSGSEISIGNLAQTILSLVNKDLPIVCQDERVRPSASEVARLCADSKKLRTLTGWQPRHSLQDGLKKTIPWMEKNLERYRSDLYAV